MNRLLISLVLCQCAMAQGYDTPLTIQGLDHATLQSAASRAAGGITIGVRDEPALMFTNPASLGGLTGIRVSLGAQQQFTKATQVQQYGPLKYGFPWVHSSSSRRRRRSSSTDP